MSTKKRTRYLVIFSLILFMTYLLLLIPESDVPVAVSGSPVSHKQAFVWNQDDYWQSLEKTYAGLRRSGCTDTESILASDFTAAENLLQKMRETRFTPVAREFSELETLLFEIGPIIGACRKDLPRYISLITDMRALLKQQSVHWDMNSDTARRTIYRLLYGGRTALEEIMMQIPAGTVPALIMATEEPSQTPSAMIRNVKIHSGDILVSRGGAPTSALIARGNDYPGNFSHIAFVYFDPETHEARIVESHIEVGVVASTVEEYLNDKKLRVMLLRPRADLPQIVKDPVLPHKAAEFSHKRVSEGHIPYDFEMNYKDHTKLFCSEVASEGYEKYGIHLWSGISHISSPGLRKWLGAFGVRHFETQEPSDLEYDPQLVVVAEWRDPETLRKDRIDNAVTEVMLEGAEEGDELAYQWYLLPIARAVKGYSMVLNQFGKAGPIPEGMSATAGLRTTYYSDLHDALAGRLTRKADAFMAEQGYEPPYWELVRLAREVKNKN
jgi:hypothetical protein